MAARAAVSRSPSASRVAAAALAHCVAAAGCAGAPRAPDPLPPPRASAPRDAGEPAPFVTRRGTCLVRGGRVLRLVGSSAFYLQEDAAREALGREADRGRLARAFDAAARAGVGLLRVAAFHDGDDDGAIQPRRGELAETGLRGLDRVIAEAGRRGVLLVLVVSNYWGDYGGVPQYLRWRGLDPRETQRAFTDPPIAQDLAEYAARVARRVNSVTGVRYADDPTIAAWEVMNEPRGAGLADDGATLVAALVRVAAALHAAAPRQLVLAGDEGFDADARGYDAGYWAAAGRLPLVGPARHESFRRVAAEPAFDATTLHWYPERWGVRPELAAEAGARWVREHARIAAAYGKPLVLEEFGLLDEAHGGVHPRDARRAAYELLFAAARAEPNVAAVMPWGLSYRLDPVRPDGYEWGAQPGEDDPYAPLVRRWAALLAREPSALAACDARPSAAP